MCAYSELGQKLNPVKAHTSIGNWEKKIAEPSLEEINTLARIFEISAADLLFKDLSAEKEEVRAADSLEQNLPAEKQLLPSVVMSELKNTPFISGVSESAESYGQDSKKAQKALQELKLFYPAPGAFNVFDLESPAATGRAITLLEEDKTRLKPNLYLPELGPGVHIRMPAKGNSMKLTIKDEDRVVGTWVSEGYKGIREGLSYIVLDNDDDVTVKRLYVVSNRRLRLVSDNNANDENPPYFRELDEIRAVFQVRRIHRDPEVDKEDIQTEFQRIRQEWASFQAIIADHLKQS